MVADSMHTMLQMSTDNIGWNDLAWFWDDAGSKSFNQIQLF
jgi:hypothetical protein